MWISTPRNKPWNAFDTVQFNLARSEFVTAQRPGRRVAIICGVLGVSSSDYYAWRKRLLSARAQMHVELGSVIAAIHRESRRTWRRQSNFGYRRVLRANQVVHDRDVEVSLTGTPLLRMRLLRVRLMAHTPCKLESHKRPSTF